MWLFCGGMHRSGSTLQFQLVSSLVELQGNGLRVGWEYPDKVKRTVQAVQDRDGNDYDFYVMKSHVPVLTISNMVDNGVAKAFYIYRDLRDVVLSTMWKHNIKFEHVWESTTLSDAIRWGKSWELMPDVYTVRYEDIVQGMRGEVERLAAFLHLPCPASVSMSIANAHSIKSQKEVTENLTADCLFHPTELLHKNHIGKANGQPGQWRQHLTWKQIKTIEGRYGEWLVGHGYDLLIQSS